MALRPDLLLTVYINTLYIVSGGLDSSNTGFASTETLEKDGGRAWQEVASLPEARWTHRPGTGQWTVHSDRSVKYNNYIMFNKQNIRI